MIDDEPHPGVVAHQRERGRQLARFDKDVVGEIGLADGGDAAAHLFLCEPLGIGLVVHLVADPDELGAARAGAQLCQLLRNVRRKVDPPDHARDEVMLRGRREELASLIEARARLDEDRLVDAVRGEQRLQVLGAEPPADRRERLGHPRIGRIGRVPEMMVSVYDHAAPSGYPYSRSDWAFISML